MIRQNGLLLLTFILCGIFFAAFAVAEDARVLPQGRSRFTFIAGQTAGITQTFNNDGNVQSVTHQYNIALNAANLAKFNDKMNRLIDYLNNTPGRYDPSLCNTPSKCMSDDLSKPRLGDALARGFLHVAAEANQHQFSGSYQYGVTDRLTIGAMVPLVAIDVLVDHSVNGDNTANHIYHGMGGAIPSDINASLDYLRSLNSESFQELLVSKGYNRFGDFHGKGLGDAVVGARYNYANVRYRSGEWISSIQLGATVPLGNVRHPRDLTAVDFGQGAWDIAGAHLTNYNPARWLMLSNGIHYTAPLKSSRVMWPRANVADAVPDQSSEENVDIWLGDKVWTTFGAQINFTESFSVDSSYELYWKKKNRYQGTRPKDYSYLADETDKFSGTLSFGASISTIPSFMKNNFLVPLNINLNYYLPIKGRNSLIAPYGTAELALYF
jgi:hypothetical protein